MPAFGQYETVRELNRGGLGSVWSARPVGAAAGEPGFAVKLCEPDPEITGHDVAARAVEQFLDAAGVQQAAAAAGPAHWAPVHDSGLCESGAYLVTDLFPRSLERLAGSRVRMDAPGLHRIVSSVVAGLVALQKTGGRAHGNLKLTNVLVGPGEPGEARVVVTDPVPSRAVPALKPGADARALGEIIHQLVLHQPFRGAYPIAESPEWSGMGRRRQAWIALLNRLLDPHPEGGPATLEQIEEALGGLAAAKPAGRGKLIAVVGAVIVIAAGGMFLLTQTSGGGGGGGGNGGETVDISWLPEGRENWEALCEAYEAGLAAFIRNLDAKPDVSVDATGTAASRRELYKKDASIAAALAELDAARAEGADPGTLDGRGAGADPDRLRRQPSEKAQSGQSMMKARRMVAAIRQLHDAIAGRWQPAEVLRAEAEGMQRRGWSMLADKLRIVAREAADEEWRTRADRMDRVLAAEAAVLATRARIDRLDALATRLAASGDRVLGAFGDWINTAGASPAVLEMTPVQAMDELGRSLGAIETTGGAIEAALAGPWRSVDVEDFNARSAAHRDLTDPPKGEVFESWLRQVTDGTFAKPDPALDPTRGDWIARARLQEARQKLARLQNEFRQPSDPERDRRVETLAAAVEATAAIDWNRRNVDRKTAEATRVVGEVERLVTEASRLLDNAIEGQIAGIEDARRRLADATRVVANSEAINEVWDGWRQQYLASITEANYADIPARAREARDALVDFNEAMGAPPAAVDPSRAWNRDVAGAAAAERERVIASALAGIRATAPQDGGAAARQAIDSAVRGYQDWCDEVTDLTRGINAVEDLLNQAYGLAEDAPGGPVGVRAEELLARRAAAGAGVRAALGPVERRVIELKRIEGLNDAGQLAAAVANSLGESRSPESALAAWRRLGTTGWPSSLAELRQEQDLRSKLGVEVRVIADPARQSALSQELADGSKSRWLKAASALRDPAEFEAAVGLMTAFGVAAGDVRDSRVAYNLAALELKRLVTNAPGSPAATDEQVAARAALFANRISELDARVREDPRVAPVLAILTQIASGSEPPEVRPDITRLGPGAVAGWAGEELDGGERVRFTPPGGAPIEFRLVPATDAMPVPVFMSVTEVSVAMAQAILADTDTRAAFLNLLPEGPLEGPGVWVSTGGRIAVNTMWLSSNVDNALGRLTEAKFTPIVQALRGGDRPVQALPMQQISPAAAMFAARVAGCRLPTSAEWQAAHAAHAGGDTGWNLRDQAWEARRARVAELDAQLLADKVAVRGWLPWPDQGVFIPPGRGADIPTGARARAGTGNDAQVWFAPVDADGERPLRHLVGNVAEFVFDDATAADGVPPAADAVRALVAGSASAVGIIGGSALSAPNLETDRPHRIDPLDVQDLKRYADVGFRLAFTASGMPSKRKTFAQRVNEALTSNPYLAPG